MLATGGAQAHELDSAALSLSEVDGGRFLVRWHASSPTMQGDLGTAVRFPASCHLAGVELTCGSAGLDGTVAFPWIEGSVTRVVVDVQWRDGTHLLRVATPTTPGVRIYGTPSSGWRALGPIVEDYATLGIEHILTGFDHLLFVVALALMVRGRLLVGTITAFTFAHSLSLALTVLGIVRVPAPPVEASIALSIVLVSAECLRPGDSLTRRIPWAVAVAFGLLHGLGFASALLELGVPAQHLPSALVSFNVGVELGQLAIIAVVVGLRVLVRRRRAHGDFTRRLLVYAIGSLAAFWSIDRIRAVFGR